MKITIELPESDLRHICEITNIQKKGPAIRKVLDDALQLRRRAEVSGKFLSGEWSADLAAFKAAKASERAAAKSLSEVWLD